MCGVDIEVPLKKAQPLRRLDSDPSHTRDRAEDVDADRGQVRLDREINECRALAAEAGEDVLVRGVMNSWNVAAAEAVVAPDARSAAPSFWPIMTAGILSSKPAVLAIASGLRRHC